MGGILESEVVCTNIETVPQAKAIEDASILGGITVSLDRV